MISAFDIDYADMGCDPDDGEDAVYDYDYGLEFDRPVDFCCDCGREAIFNCDRCGAPLCGMCAELGLNLCRECAAKLVLDKARDV